MRRSALGARILIEGGAATILLAINIIPISKALYTFLISVPIGLAIALVLSWDAIRLKRKLDNPESQLFGDAPEKQSVGATAPPEN